MEIRGRVFGVIAAASIAAAVSAQTHAQTIAPDNTLGTAVTLEGQTYAITEGTKAGSNLFHSFSRFDLEAGFAADFRNTVGGDIANVISRVTGEVPSHINGLIQSSVEGADFFLINPAGIVFGPNAALDVQGSFHVSTADFIQLEDGMLFSASLSGQAPLLSTAPPEAFGFLDNNVGGIEVQDANLEIPAEQAFSLIGGEVVINDGSLIAPSGVANIAAAGGEGMVSFRDGQVHLAEDQPRHSIISKNNFIIADGGRIHIVGGDVEIGDIDNPNTLFSTAGLEEIFELEAPGSNSVSAEVQGRVAPGIVIESENLMLNNPALLSPAQENQAGGDVIIKVSGNIQMVGALIDTSTATSSNAGDISIISGTLDLTQATLLQTGSFGSGQPGDISIKVKGDVTLTNSATFSSSRSFAEEPAPVSVTSGDVLIEAKNLTLRSEGGGVTTVQSDSFSNSSGGKITFNVEEEVLLTGEHTFLTSDASGEGDAGIIEIKSGRLVVTEGAKISAESGGTGPSGSLIIQADILELRQGGEISALTKNANAGSIAFHIGKLLLLRDDSGITTSVQGGKGEGGDITIAERESPNQTFLILDASSEIKASAVGGPGGNIDINTDSFIGPRENVNASSRKDISGTIAISAPETNIISGILSLPASFLDTASLLDSPCVARANENTNHFLVKNREGLSPEPDALLPGQISDLNKSSPQPREEDSSNRDIMPLPATQGINFKIGC